jgi:hypothetical protein
MAVVWQLGEFAQASDAHELRSMLPPNATLIAMASGKNRNQQPSQTDVSHSSTSSELHVRSQIIIPSTSPLSLVADIRSTRPPGALAVLDKQTIACFIQIPYTTLKKGLRQ